MPSAWQQLSSLQVDLKVLLNHLHNWRSIETNNNNNNNKRNLRKARGNGKL